MLVFSNFKITKLHLLSHYRHLLQYCTYMHSPHLKGYYNLEYSTLLHILGISKVIICHKKLRIWYASFLSELKIPSCCGHGFIMTLKGEQLSVIGYYKLCRREDCEVEKSFP